MTLFAGIAAGMGQAQQQYNQELLKSEHEHAKSIADMYSHLAEQQGIDPSLRDMYLQSAQTAAMYNPLDRASAKSFKQLVKQNPADIVSQYAAMRKSRLSDAMLNSPANTPVSGVMDASQPKQPDYTQPPDPSMRYDPNTGMQSPEYTARMSGFQDYTKSQGVLGGKLHLLQQTLDDPEFQKLSPSEQNIRLIGTQRMIGMNIPPVLSRRTPEYYYRVDGSGQLSYHRGERDYFGNLTDEANQPERAQVMRTQDLQLTQDPKTSQWIAHDKAGNVYRVSDGPSVKVGTQSVTTPGPWGGSTTESGPAFRGGIGAGPTPGAGTPPPPVTGAVGAAASPVTKAAVKPGASVARGGAPAIHTPPVYDLNAPGAIEALKNGTDQEKMVHDVIVNPDNFAKLPAQQKLAWGHTLQKYGLPSIGPTPLDSKFQTSRESAVAALEAARDIQNIISDTDGRLVGAVAGRFLAQANKLGYEKLLAAGIDRISGKPTDRGPRPDPLYMQSLVKQENPGLSDERVAEIASKAADLITTMRTYNFRDVRNTIGGVQGIARTYEHLEDALVSPKMGPNLIAGHLNSLNRVALNVLHYVESQRWGKGEDIPWIKEKDLLGQLRFDPKMNAVIDNISKQKGIPRGEVVFQLWKAGQFKPEGGIQ